MKKVLSMLFTGARASVAVCMLTMAPSDLSAQEDGDGIIEQGEDEIAEMARAVQNPVASLISLPFQNNTTFKWGPQEEVLNVTNIQPVLPFTLGQKWNLITRTIFPLISQPAILPDQDRIFGLGPTVFSSFLSPSKASKFIWGGGFALQIPTETNDRLGPGVWGLGPSVVLVGMPGDFVVGALLNNIWSLGGDTKVNFLFTQWFVNYNMSNGWYLTSAPIITANWEADEGNKWTVPLGGGAGKIFRMGSQPMNLNFQIYYNVASPEFGGKWNSRIQLQFMFPKRRG